MRVIAARVSSVALAMCGVRTTFGSPRRRSGTCGSCTKTSRPALMRPLSSSSASAFSSTTAPRAVLMSVAPSRSSARRSREISPVVSAFSGVWSETMSARPSSSSSGVSRVWITSRSKPAARRAAALPIRPKPTMPRTDPPTSRPRNGLADQPFSHRPARTAMSPSTMRRRTASRSPIVRSATAASSTPGVFETATPRRRHASMSMRSYPTLKFAIRRSAGNQSRSTGSLATIRISTSSRGASCPISRSPSSAQASPGGRSVASTFTPRVQQVPRVAVDELAHAVRLEERAREAELRRRGRVEERALLRAELDIDGAEVVLELLRVAHAHDWDELGFVAAQQPRDRGLGRRAPEVVRDISHGGSCCRLPRRDRVPPAERLRRAARKHAVLERTPRHHGQPELRRHRQHLALRVAGGEAVRHLHCDERRPTAQLCDRVRSSCDPCRRVRDADVEHLAEAHLVVERAHELLDRRRRIAHVQPEEIDVVGLEMPQAALERAHEALAMIAARVRIAAVERQRVLRRNDPALAVVLRQVADDAFARAVRVVRRRIDEVAARLPVALQDPAALRLVGTPAPVRPEGHRPECELRDPQPARAEQAVAHAVLLVV